MKLLVVLLYGFVLSTLPIKEIRERYVDAAQAKNKDKALTLQNDLEDVSHDDKPVLLGYKGASKMLASPYHKGILAKKKNFMDGAALLEEAIRADKNNLELRVLRLGIQEHAPKIAGYFQNKIQDKRFIMSYFKEQPVDIKEFATAFIKGSVSFSDEDRIALNIQ